MGWRDSLAYTQAVPKTTNWGAWQQAKQQRSLQSSRSPLYTAAGSSGWGKPTAASTPYQQANFPEAINITPPWSSASAQPKPPAAPTTGDLFGSLSAAVGNAVGTGGFLNLANAIPWGMERVGVLTKELARTITGTDQNAISKGIDDFSAGLGEVAKPIAGALDFFPNAMRDQTLRNRANAYQGLVQGKADPLSLGIGAGFSQFLSLITAGASNALANPFDTTGAQAASPDMAVRRAAMDSIDLPASTKRAIENNPAADPWKAVEAAPEGKQFSYTGGMDKQASALLTTGALYGIETLLGGAALKGLQAGTQAAVSGSQISQGVYNVAAAGARGAFAVQKAALATGIGYFGLSTAADTVARTQGNQAAVEWWDRMNRSTLISQDPAIQLVTSFAVDPIGAAGLAKKGMIGAPHGLASYAVGKVVAKQMTNLYHDTPFILDRLGAMFGTTREGAAALIGPEQVYATPQAAMDRIVEVAWDYLNSHGNIPAALKEGMGAITDAHERTAAVLKAFGPQIVDVVKNRPDALRERFLRAWEYHQYDGPFDPHVMALNEADYMVAREQMAQARAASDSVVGYVDYLNPEGQAKMAADVDALFTRGDVTLRDLNALKVKYPALNDLTRDLVTRQGAKASTDLVPRSLFDDVQARAKAAYDDANKANPQRVATGADPILRPGSPTATRDWAGALGTDEPTVAAIQSASMRPAENDLVRAFAEKKGIDITGSPQDVWGRVNDWVTAKTKPWVERGAVVENLETERFAAQQEMQKIELSGDRSPEARIRSNELATRSAQISGLLADVRDPVVPFSQNVRLARKASVNAVELERAQRKVSAETAIDHISAIDDDVASWNTIGDVTTRRNVTTYEKAPDGSVTKGSKVVETHESPLYMIRKTRAGTWGWAGTKPPMTDSMFSRLADYLYLSGSPENQSLARSLSEMGDENLWQVAVSRKDAAAFRKTLTAQQRRTLDGFAGRTGSTMDEYMQAWGRKGGLTHPSDVDFMEYLTKNREARDNLLGGKTINVLRRTAESTTISDWALARARANEPADLFYDPEADLARNAARSELGRATASEDTFSAVAGIVKSDDVLYGQASEMANRAGVPVDDFLADPANREQIGALGGDPAIPAVPGVPKPQTELDQAIIGGQTDLMPEITAQMADIQGTLPPPLQNVPKDVADALSKKRPPSVTLSDSMANSGVHYETVIDPAEWTRNGAAARGSSMILWGEMAHPPKTLGGLITVLKEIERGNAAHMGMGTELAADVQRTARDIIERTVASSRKSVIETGVLGMGKGLNPRTWGEDTFQLMRDLFDRHGTSAGIIVRDDNLGIQYGLKQRPKDAVVLEMSTVPGMAEELLTGHYRPWTDRVAGAQVRQMYNYLFGPLHNQTIAFEALGRFTERLTAQGIPAELASKIWRRWKDEAAASKSSQTVRLPNGDLTTRPGNNALYASSKNIPNSKLLEMAQDEMHSYFGANLPAGANAINFADEFRLAGSSVRRSMEQVPVLGDLLQQMYGTVMHNSAVTTMYYMFRFGLDLRFHAMDKFEGPLLYLGMSGGKVAELREGMFGMTQESLTRIARDGLADTGYPFSNTRAAWAYKTFLERQPAKLRGLLAEDPVLMERAIRYIADNDPELSATISAMGHTTNQYLSVMHDYYKKITSAEDPGAMASAEAMRELTDSPELAEVLGRIADVNQGLWNDVRGTFYGNPARSRVERWLNHPLLYWPISYQIKASKWMLRIMFDRAGGLKTNAGGAYVMNEIESKHQELLKTDPEYAQFFIDHPTLVFAAQMLVPMTPASMGVSLAPILRDVFFGRTKQITAIGPVYTYTKLLPQMAGELYQDLGSVPGMDAAYSAVAGKPPPKIKVQ